MDKIATLIPCLNEEKNIYNVVSEIKNVLPETIVYVYDNKSTDNTVKEAERAGAIVRNEYSTGKGNVIKKMFKEVEAECYFLCDGDMACDIKPVAKTMCDMIFAGKDMVIGNRIAGGYNEKSKKKLHKIGNNIVAFIVKSFFGGEKLDAMSGYRTLSNNLVKGFIVSSEGFEIDTEMTVYALKEHMDIEMIPIEYNGDNNESKIKTFQDGIKIIKFLFAYKCKFLKDKKNKQNK